MKRVRIKNDLTIDWSITRCGVPEDFSDREVSVHLRHSFGEDAKIKWSIEGNVVHIVFFGMDQRRVGKYMLILTENEGKPEMAEIDHCEAVELVPHSMDEGGESCSNIKVNHIDVRGDLEFLSDSYTKRESDSMYQPKGDYVESTYVKHIVSLSKDEYEKMAEHDIYTLYVITD